MIDFGLITGTVQKTGGLEWEGQVGFEGFEGGRKMLGKASEVELIAN